MTRQEFVAIIRKGGTGVFTLRGKECGWCSFTNCRFQYDASDETKTCKVGVGNNKDRIYCETAEEILERFSIDGVPFVDLLPEIHDMRAIPCA